MELGGSDERGPNWLARMLNLRDREDLEPFRLTLLASTELSTTSAGSIFIVTLPSLISAGTRAK